MADELDTFGPDDNDEAENLAIWLEGQEEILPDWPRDWGFAGIEATARARGFDELYSLELSLTRDWDGRGTDRADDDYSPEFPLTRGADGRYSVATFGAPKEVADILSHYLNGGPGTGVLSDGTGFTISVCLA